MSDTHTVSRRLFSHVVDTAARLDQPVGLVGWYAYHTVSVGLPEMRSVVSSTMSASGYV